MNGLSEGNGRAQAQSWVPTLDVWETEDSVFYAFDLPGLTEDQISVEVEEGALTVSANRKREVHPAGERFQRFERRYGMFSRTVGLPQGVSEDAIEASYRNGVLEIRAPKPEQPKPKRVSIKGSSGEHTTIEAKAGNDN
jgi:HSP20 family protein